MARNVTEVDFISDKIYDRVHDKDAFMSTVYRYKAGTKEWKNYIKEHYVPGWKDIMASEIKEVIDSFKNTDILVDFYSPSYDVFYNKYTEKIALLRFRNNQFYILSSLISVR